MLLQKMAYREGGDIFHFVCSVNLYRRTGEYTLCGSAISDTTLLLDGCERKGNLYRGNLKEVTCPNCLNLITYIKNFQTNK